MKNILEKSSVILICPYRAISAEYCAGCRAKYRTLYEFNTPEYIARKYIGDVRCRECAILECAHYGANTGRIIIRLHRAKNAFYREIFTWILCEKTMLCNAIFADNQTNLREYNCDVARVIINWLFAIHCG